MSYHTLQAILGTAITDREFSSALLSSPAEAVNAFNLAEEELAAVTAIRADSLEEFAAKLDEWITQVANVEYRRLHRRPAPHREEALLLTG